MSSELVKQTITFQLNQTSGVPAYLQIVQQVEQALRMGTLRPGDQLPTVKQVVAEVTINPNTVTKAYRELEHAARPAPRSWPPWVSGPRFHDHGIAGLPEGPGYPRS